jgi:hypothetical protein
VARQRTQGGLITKGSLVYFLDADTIPSKDFIEDTADSFVKRKLDIACTFYSPNSRNLFINIIYEFFNLMFFLTQWFLPSGAGMCIMVKGNLFKNSGGFSSKTKYDDIEFIRRVAKKNKFGIIPKRLKVSDRRFRKYGVVKMFIKYLILSLFFNIGKYDWAEKVNYPFGEYSSGHSLK